jgi:hypothetical protein
MGFQGVSNESCLAFFDAIPLHFATPSNMSFWALIIAELVFDSVRHTGGWVNY